MNRTGRVVLFLCLAVLALLAGAGARKLIVSEREQALQQLRQLVLPDTEGRSQPLSQWQGKVLVVNFWATWCEPCREEVPALVRSQQKNSSNGLQIVGISVDSAGKIRQFAQEYHINYPLVVAGFDAVDITRKLGNRVGGLPYTVVLDREGRFVASHVGGLSEERLEALLRPLLSS